MTSEQAGMAEHMPQERDRAAGTSTGPGLDFDWKELFLGQRRPVTLFDGFRERIERMKSKQGGRGPKNVSLVPAGPDVVKEICDTATKHATRQARLTDVLRARDLPDLLKAETARISDMALSGYADAALLRAEGAGRGTEDVWKWIGEGKRRPLSRSDWQQLLAVLFLRRLNGILTARQVNEFVWRALFAEMRISPEYVLTELDKDAVFPIDESLCSDLVSRMAGGSGRLEERLVVILQQCGGSKTVVTEQILAVAERFLTRKDMPLCPALSPQDKASVSIENWLGKRKKTRLAQKETHLFFAAILVGHRRDSLPEEEATRMLHTVLAASGNKKKGQKTDEAPGVLPAVLAVPPGKAAAPAFEVFVQMQGQLRVVEADLVKVQSRLGSVCAQNERLQGVIEERNAEIAGLNDKVVALESDKVGLENRVAGLEKDLLRFQDGLTHRIDQLRSKVRSVLEGPATRHLQNALEAIHADPPWIEAAEERIEDAMKVLRKEAECLRPSQ